MSGITFPLNIFNNISKVCLYFTFKCLKYKSSERKDKIYLFNIITLFFPPLPPSFTAACFTRIIMLCYTT